MKNLTLKHANQLFLQGSLALERAERQGVCIDVKYCNKVRQDVEKRIEVLLDDFKHTDLWKVWYKCFPGKANIGSTDQLGHVLYNVMQLDKPKETPGGKGSVDSESLSKLNNPDLDLLLQIRKLRKANDTYISSFLREQVDGVLHTIFSLNKATTYRSASEAPNLQNVPVRDEEFYELCRRAIRPRKGYRFLEVDYSALEVRIAAAITGDERLIEDVLHGDMHKDMAMELYDIKSLDKNHKGEGRLRQGAKNGFVFPQFYGDFYKNNVKLLMEWAEGVKLKNGTPMTTHLRRKGFVRYSPDGVVIDVTGFESHVQGIERDFWRTRYRMYGRWKERTWEHFNKHGFVKLPTGFVVRGALSKNQILNAPIQGSAFHCLLWSFIRLDHILRIQKLKTRLVMQVHDSILLDVHPSELHFIAQVVNNVMTHDVKRYYEWITVPLEVDMKLYGLDGTWFEGKEYKGGK